MADLLLLGVRHRVHQLLAQLLLLGIADLIGDRPGSVVAGCRVRPLAVVLLFRAVAAARAGIVAVIGIVTTAVELSSRPASLRI